jgi:MFS family permease
VPLCASQFPCTDPPSYGATFLGWLFAAATNSHLVRFLGLGAILTFGACIQIVAHALRCWTPPFGLYVVTFFLQAVGMAYNESHANTFVASLDGAHRLLGFIHAMYALGTLVSPFVATAIATKIPDQWPLFYIYLVGVGIINALIVAIMFRDSLGRHLPSTSISRSKTANRDIIATLKSPPVYLLSMFYFFMLGTGITAGGWVVEYLVQARNGHLPEVGYVPAALWGGILLGRIVLAEPTHRFGERRMTLLYCVLILILQLVFWLVPNLISSAVSLCLLGVFYGPMFATVRFTQNTEYCEEILMCIGHVDRFETLSKRTTINSTRFRLCARTGRRCLLPRRHWHLGQSRRRQGYATYPCRTHRCSGTILGFGTKGEGEAGGMTWEIIRFLFPIKSWLLFYFGAKGVEREYFIRSKFIK